MTIMQIQPESTWRLWREAMRIAYLETYKDRPLRASCAHCWGQGRLWEPFEAGGMVAIVCAECRNGA